MGVAVGSGDHRDFSRNSAACTHPRGAVRAHVGAPMGYPAPVGRRTLGRVAGAAQHRGVADVERRSASSERHNVIDSQIARRMGGALVARAPAAVLTAPGTEHAGTEPLPGPGAVHAVVPAAVGRPGVRRAPTARAAGDDTTDRAQLHPRIVDGGAFVKLRGNSLPAWRDQAARSSSRGGCLTRMPSTNRSPSRTRAMTVAPPLRTRQRVARRSTILNTR